MRKRLQRAAAIGMAAILCVQNAQFGLTTFADELSDFAKMEGILNAQELRVTSADAVKNLSGGAIAEDSDTDENGEIKENPDGNLEGQENKLDDMEKASDSDAKKEENSDIGDNTKKDETKKDPVNGSEKSQILSWNWVDGEAYFVEGKILLSVGEEDQVSFDELITMLPTEISAEVLRAEETAAAETIQIRNWTSSAYVQDSEGRWPTKGEFIFTAVLPEEYELAEETAPVEAVVSLDGDAVMEMDVNPQGDFILYASDGNNDLYYYVDNGKLKHQGSEITGVVVTKDSSSETYRISLSNVTLNGLAFRQKQFEVTLTGTVNVDMQKSSDTPLMVYNNANVEIKGSGAMHITNHDSRSTGIYVGSGSSKLIINCSAGVNIQTELHSTDTEGVDGVIRNWGTFQIEKGTVSVSGTSPYGLYNVGNLTINTGASLKLNSAGMYNDIHSNIENNGALEVNNHSALKPTSMLVNNGKWIQNALVESTERPASSATVIKVGPKGTIEGSGAIAAGMKPDSGFTSTTDTQTMTWSRTINLDQFFSNPRKQNVTYTLNGTNDSSVSYIEGNNLIVEERGAGQDYSITATAEDTRFWSPKKVTITLNIRPLALTGVQIIPYEGNYDGNPHDMVRITGTSPQAIIKYMVCRYNSYRADSFEKGEWTDVCPQVTNVSEAPPEEIGSTQSGIYEGIRLYIYIKDNGKEYKTQEEGKITLDDTEYFKVILHPKKISDSDIEVTAESRVYDPNVSGGKDGMKSLITVKYKGETLDGKFWNVSKITPPASSGMNNDRYGAAGNYTVTLNAPAEYYPVKISVQTKPNNFIGDRDITFTIQKENIHPIAYNHTEVNKKVYDGTTDVPETILTQFEAAPQYKFYAENANNVNRSSILRFNRDSGGTAVYSSKDVGTNNDVILSGLELGYWVVNNYELTTNQLTLPGEITRAKLDSTSEVKAKAPLIYTGTAQQPKVVYDIKGIAGDSSKNIPAERSTNAENDGTTANAIDGFQIVYKVTGADNSAYSTEVPLFKEIGTHQVDYKVTSTNYEDLTGTFEVTIQKMNLADSYVEFENSLPVYTGSALNPGVTVKGSETSTDTVSETDYSVTYQRIQDALGNAVKEDAVTAPTEAGTYNVIITAKQESNFAEGEKTVGEGVTVLPKALSDTQGKPAVSISMTPGSFTYDTKVHQVKDEDIVVTDTDRNVILTQEIDYEITPPSDPIQTAKTYTFTFTGKGNYTGSCTKDIEVEKPYLYGASIEITGTYTYNGEEQKPDASQVRVTVNGILVDPSEYTLGYGNNINAAEDSSDNAPVVGISAKENGNYIGTVSKTFTILRKPLKVTAENKQVTYKEDAPEFTAVYDGFVGGETLESVGGTIEIHCEYENGSTVGDYEIRPEVTGLANYEVTANKGTLSVLPRTPEFVNSENLYTTRVYDGKAVDLAPTTDGDGEMSYVITNRETNEVLTSDPIDVGKYHVVYNFAAGTNYSAGSVEYDFDITPAPLKITAADQKLLYLDEIPEYTAAYDGFVNGENLESAGGTVHFDCSYQKGTAVGSYPINPEVTGLKNYEVTTESGMMTVERRTPLFTDSINLYTTRVYDGKAVDLTPATDGDGTMSRVITNRETNEVLTSDPVDVGEYRVVYSVSEGKNYTEGSVSYDFAITQAPLVITAEDKNVVFGAKAPEYTVVYDGFVNGETEAVLTGTLVVTCAYTEESREYTYEIVPSGLSSKNYAITWKNGVLTGHYRESDSDDYEETSKPANSKMPKSGTNNSTQGATVKDAQKGYVNENSGIVSGKTLTEEMLTNNSESLNDGYSHWIRTDAGWWFRYADGSYPKAAGAANSGSGNVSAARSYEWVQIDGSWWSFDSDGYLATGWIFDPVYRNWFYMDVNTGMKTGWVLIDGKWYYFNPVSDGTKGIMFANRMTPDGWFVREDGSWDEKR